MPGVTVTERAAEELRRTLAEASTEEGQVLRLVAQPEGRGFALGTDQIEDGDETVEADGETVLVITSSLAETLEGAVIDVDETDDGPRLSISR
jgi:Fe-S cluster assembly iron-binding protein IscA